MAVSSFPFGIQLLLHNLLCDMLQNHRLLGKDLKVNRGNASLDRWENETLRGNVTCTSVTLQNKYVVEQSPQPSGLTLRQVLQIHSA